PAKVSHISRRQESRSHRGCWRKRPDCYARPGPRCLDYGGGFPERPDRPAPLLVLDRGGSVQVKGGPDARQRADQPRNRSSAPSQPSRTTPRPQPELPGPHGPAHPRVAADPDWLNSALPGSAGLDDDTSSCGPSPGSFDSGLKEW